MDSAAETDPDLLDKVTNLAKRRGFIFASAEIYGGFRSTYDYGPLGVNMLRNVKAAWWRDMVQMRQDVVGIDAAILGPPAVWAASGHLETFTDPLVDCRKCKERWREDKINGVCPNCGSTEFTEARAFNLMFKTQAGPVEGEGATAYLRPETAQGMFTNFNNVLSSTRKKPPFGIAQVGKSFRNEITPQNFVFRTREFEQMEMEYFVPPAQAEEWYRYWIDQRYNWYLDLGIPAAKLRLHEHAPEDLGGVFAEPRRMTSRTTRAAPPTSSSPIPGAGTSSRASPTAVTTTSPSTPTPRVRDWSTSTRPPTSATPPTSSSRRRAPRAR